jgi:predicted  nucleic acid-binding Zn-ribbon protein
MEGFEAVKKELEAKRMQLEHELDEAKGRLAAVEGDLRRVDEALGALTKSKKKAKKSGAPRKPALTLGELRQHLAEAQHQSPFAAGRELQDVVRSLAERSGSSMTHFEELYTQALISVPGPFDPTLS